MSFFEPLPPPPPEPAHDQPTGWRPPRWDRPSEALLGAPVALALLLAKTDELAVAIDDVKAFPNGFTFALAILRNPMLPRQMGPGGIMGFGPQQHAHGPRVGFEFSDGTQARVGGPGFPGFPVGATTSQMLVARASDGPRNAFGVPTDSDGLPLAPFLVSRGGGGGGDRFEQRFWCYPLPPPGPMSVHLEWADRGIEEVSVTTDADAILDAVTNVVTLWDAEE